jgi:hypothetical protein
MRKIFYFYFLNKITIKKLSYYIIEKKKQLKNSRDSIYVNYIFKKERICFKSQHIK